MSPLNREVLRRKLERIVLNLRLMEPFQRMPIEDYLADVYRRKALERLLQEIVEAAVDINSHVLVESGRPAPDDLYTSFLNMADLGVFDRDFAERIAPSSGLRNRLVHGYDAIDDSLVLQAVKIALEQYSTYVAKVESYLLQR